MYLGWGVWDRRHLAEGLGSVMLPSNRGAKVAATGGELGIPAIGGEGEIALSGANK